MQHRRPVQQHVGGDRAATAAGQLERHPIGARNQMRQRVAARGVGDGRSRAGHDIALGRDDDIRGPCSATQGDDAFDAARLLRCGHRGG